jgi:hypothetical protein
MQKIKKLVVLLLIAVPVFVSAQQNGKAQSKASPARYFQMLGWDKDEHAAWYEVSVDREESSGIWNNIISKQKTEESDLQLQLEPGRYRFRVQAFNAKGSGGETSEWMLFDVRPIAKTPSSGKSGAARNPDGKRHFSFGFGTEINANTQSGQAYGAMINGELGINNSFAFGLKTAASYNFSDTLTVEPAFFLRWYAVMLGTWGSIFIQADAGSTFIFYTDKTQGEFMGGVSAGMRFTLKHFYIEPSAGWGVPFLWRAGLGLGFTRG